MNSPAANRVPPGPPKWLKDLSHRANTVPICCYLVFFVAITFYPVLLNGFIHYDDPDYVTGNPLVRQGLTWTGLKWAMTAVVSSNWHPLTMISHMMDCQFFGLSPWGHHLVNVLFHAANTVLVFLVFRRLTGATGRSLIVALLFGLHPLRVESVAWAAERKDGLSAFFWLLSLGSYIGYVEELKTKSRNLRVYYARTLGFFVLGLLAKPMVVTLPFVFLLLDYWPLRRTVPDFTIWKRLIVEKLPFFLLSVGSCVVTYAVQKDAGAMGLVLPLGYRLENAVISYCRYIGKMFWPFDLTLLYPFPQSWPLEEVVAAGVVLVVITLFALMWRRERPYFIFGWFWYLGTLVPVIGIVQVGLQSMADRYTYLSTLGLLIMLVWGLCELTQYWRQQANASVAACVFVSIACIGITHHQIKYWRNDEVLFRHALAITTDNWPAHNNLASALMATGRYDEAVVQLRASLKIQPNASGAHSNLGIALRDTGHSTEAITELCEAIRLAPQVAGPHFNLGVTYGSLGQMDDAIKELQEAHRLGLDSAELHYCLAEALNAKGRLDDAIREYKEALQRRPNFIEARTSLEKALTQQQQKQQ